MSGQAESRHFFTSRDEVEDLDGRRGSVVGWSALYATILWSDGVEEELEQFDPAVAVTRRGDQE